MTTAALRLAPRRSRAFFNVALRYVCFLYLSVIVVAIVIYKATFVEVVVTDPVFGVYSIVVCAYILSRFGFSLLYHPRAGRIERLETDPTVAIVMPAFNEERAIASSIRSLLAVDYPIEKLEVVVVNDGSTDATLEEIEAIAAREPRVQVINFPQNRGKRAAMAAGIRATEAEIIAFVDSDSMLEPDALRVIVQ